MINFNGIDAPSYFKILEFNDVLVPATSQITQKVSGRAGVIDFGNEVDAREIQVKYMIKANNPVDLRTKARVIADWLSQEEEQKLIYANEPDKYYLAKLTGQAELKETLHLGEGTITFFCADPYAYSLTTKTGNIINGQATINNNGTAEVEPILDLTFTKDTPSLSIVANDEFIDFGKPQEVGQKVKDTSPVVLRDTFSTYSGWTTAAGVHDGTIAGTMGVVSGNLVATNFGEGTGWHGPAVVKGLSRPVQDFTFQGNINLRGTAKGQLGRIQVFLRSGQTIVANMSLRIGNPHALTPYAEVYMNSLGTTKVYQGYADKPLAWANYVNGAMNIKRRGNKWEFFYGIWNPKKRGYDTIRRINWTDASNNYKHKIDNIQIYISKWGDTTPLANLQFRDFTMTENNPASLGAGEVPLSFKTGDNLTINNQTGEVLLNGLPYYATMNPSSQFITLEKGANQLVIEPSNVATGLVEFTERWK